MQLSTRFLGKSIVEYLRDRQTATVLSIGVDHFDRASLAKVACFNFVAAQRLSNILIVEFQVKNTRDLFDRIPPQQLVLPRLGSISIAVLGAAFEVKGIGGENPLENWVRKHLPDSKAAIHTFTSMKVREAKEIAGEKKRTKARRAVRRDRAHNIRVTRYEERSHTIQ